MEDHEIYEIASNALNSIVDDLSRGIYAELNGTLTISWDTSQKVSAWAESLGDINSPPSHRIVICYELIRQFYRDAENYFEFASKQSVEDLFLSTFQDFDPKPRLPDNMSTMDGIKNMFIGALTWVFFHELSHLAQEHGCVRSSFSAYELTAHIEDCESDGTETFKGRAAVISHVTEIAADVEAVHWWIAELSRHFFPIALDRKADGTAEEERRMLDKNHSFLEFRGNLYLAVCGISCALYRFHGLRTIDPEAVPINSHPTPIRRLEVCLPYIFDELHLWDEGERIHGLSRRQLIDLCTSAAYSSGMFWLWHHAKEPGIQENFFPKGLLQDPFIETYWYEIIKVWDEIEPTIKKNRRFGSELSLLSFSPEFRSKVFELSSNEPSGISGV